MLKKTLNILIEKYGFNKVKDEIWKIYRMSFQKKVNSKSKIKKVIDNYNKKRKNKPKKLVICHGHDYKKKFKDYLLLDRTYLVNPNIVNDAWSLKNLPENYFDEIVMEYCPLGNPFQKDNKPLWKNLRRILKKKGKIVNSSILGLYSVNTKDKWYNKMNIIEKSKIRAEVNKHIKKLKFTNPKHTKKGNKIITTMIKDE